MKLVILSPVFNDWEAFNMLLKDIEKELPTSILPECKVLVVDDCSTTSNTFIYHGNLDVQVLRLYRNLGHQRAISVGLAYISEHFDCEKVVVMDADGEDKPADLQKLLAEADQNKGKIIFAHRSKRQESVAFKFFYTIYKLLFRSLTGRFITFGNYCVIPSELLKNLVRVSEIWNNFPGGVIQSKLPFDSIPIERGTRLAGESKMNFVSLMLHGLSAISVLLDRVAVRILLFSMGMGLLSAMVIFYVLLTGFQADSALPDWVIYLASVLLIGILQFFMIALFLVFIVLQYRTQQHFVPIVHYKQYIDYVKNIAHA